MRISSKDYRLGRADDDYAKARMSVASAALVSGKILKIRFWNYTTCDDAANERAIPNSVQLVNQG